jgi:predicted DsbA family dithiol-disulfide isomerase
MNIEIWSDVVCPWCYIGKRRLEKALHQLEGFIQVQIRWRSYELDPGAEKSIDKDMASRLSEKYRISPQQAKESMAHIASLALAEGLEYNLDGAKMTNSFDAHRLIQMASKNGLGGQMKERLLCAYFVESENISDKAALLRFACEVGLDSGEVSGMLASDAFADKVRADESLATELGISGVPFFVFDSKYAVSGAQSSEVFLEVLTRVQAESGQKSINTDEASNCSNDSCQI